MRVPASQCPGLGPVLAYLIALLHLFLRAQLERNDCCRRGRLAAGRFNNSIPGCASNIRVWFLASSSANIRINRPRAKNGSYWNLDLTFASRVAAERMSNLLHAMKNLRRADAPPTQPGRPAGGNVSAGLPGEQGGTLGGGLGNMQGVRTRAPYRFEAAIDHEGNAAPLEPRTKFGAIPIGEGVIEDSACQSVVLHKDQRVLERVRGRQRGAGNFKLLRDVHDD